MEHKVMIRSGSHHSLAEPDLSSGQDLSQYCQQLARERNSRTLTLRRRTAPSLSAILGKSFPLSQFSRSNQPNSSDSPSLQVEPVISALTSGSLSSILEATKTILSLAESDRRQLCDISKSPRFPPVIVGLLTSDLSCEIKTSALAVIATIFPISDASLFLDEGLPAILADYLSDDSPFQHMAIRTIGAIAECNVDARDSILCYELHASLSSIAVHSSDQSIVDSACDSIQKIFMHSTNIDKDILTRSVPMITALLHLTSTQAIASAISALTSISCEMSSLIFSFYDLGIYSMAVRTLSNPELTGPSLKLIGNLSSGRPSNVKSMLDDGLFEALMLLMDTNYTADVLWCLSNLIESVGHLVISRFDERFMADIIEICQNSNFVVKGEAAYFLSTFILYVDQESLASFMTGEVTDILVEMLCCGVPMLIIRSIDSIVKMLRYAQNGLCQIDYLTMLLESNDLAKKMNELCESEAIIVAERAMYLLGQLESLEIK